MVHGLAQDNIQIFNACVHSHSQLTTLCNSVWTWVYRCLEAANTCTVEHKQKQQRFKLIALNVSVAICTVRMCHKVFGKGATNLVFRYIIGCVDYPDKMDYSNTC